MSKCNVSAEERLEDYRKELAWTQDKLRQLKSAIAIHVREGDQYLGDGITSDEMAVDGFTNYWADFESR